MLAACSLTAGFVKSAYTSEPTGIYIRVLIENLRYEGNDGYSLVVMTSNASSRDLRVTIVDEGFFIQTDRGWTQLAVRHNAGEAGEFLLPSLKEHERAAVISIPLAVPHLFRTYEGDLSLAYRYTYAVRTDGGAEVRFQRTDEVYCWVKPGTSQWILREGM